MLLLNWRSPSPESEWKASEEALLAHFERSVAGWRQFWEEEGYESVQVQEISEDSRGSYSMLYAVYEFTTPDWGRVYGTIGELYCDDCGRLFELLTAARDDGSQADAVAFLRVFSSSLVCH